MTDTRVLRWLVSSALCALLAVSFACGGGNGDGEEETKDTGEVATDPGPATDPGGPGTTDEGDKPAENPCEPNPCPDDGTEGKTNCIKKSDTEYECVCGGFYEDDGEGGCKLRAAEPGTTGVDEAADWESDNPTFNATVKVIDRAGRPIAGAQMIATGTAFDADDEGIVRLADQPALAPIRYEVKAEGYAPTSVSVTLAAAGINVQKVEMSEIEVAVELPGTEGGTVKVESAAVAFPPDAFVGQDGFSVQGGVQIEMTTVDPQTDNVKAGPELIAEDDEGNKTALKAMGMVYVSITDAQGEEIAMMPNRRATMTMAIPTGSDAQVGDTLAMQSYDEERQAWVTEGECTVEEIPEDQLPADGRTLWCRGTVSHFSWWAITKPAQTLCVNSWYKVTHSEKYELKRVLQVSMSCWTFTDYPGEYCVMNAGDGKPVVEPSEETDPEVKIVWEDIVTTVVPPADDKPASTCSAMGLTDGLSGLNMIFQIWVEATDKSADGKTVWFVHTSPKEAIDTVAARLGSEHMHGFITTPKDICRNESLCTQFPVELNLDDMAVFGEPVDEDGDESFFMAGVNPRHPYARVASPDCDDGAKDVYPGAPEDKCATKDFNCDGIVPFPEDLKLDPMSMTAEAWHALCDFQGCNNLGDETPGNGHDEDCDGVILDFDDDKWISAGDAKALEKLGKTVPAGLQVGDCDDGNPKANPHESEEAGNPVDENCDGLKLDADGDTHWTVEGLMAFDFSGGMDAILEFIEIYKRGIDCDDDNKDANPAATITVDDNPEATFAQYYEEKNGIWHRKPGYCTNFHPDTGLPLIAFRSRLVDANCDFLYSDLDGDGWTVPGDHTFGADRAFDCNDLDPRVKPTGAPGSVTIADCAPMAADKIVNELECPVDAPKFVRDIQSARAGEPVCPNTPSGLPTKCVNFVDQVTGDPTTDWGCVFADAAASNPPTRPSAAGRLYGACGNIGGILPPCSEGVCGGPLRYSPQYIAELNKLFARESGNCPTDAQGNEICEVLATDWLGMCFPRCDKCWGVKCNTDNPCALPKCNGNTGQCEELTAPKNGFACEDGNPCQGGETCWEGECIYQTVMPEGTVCKTANDENGTCKHGTDAEGYQTGECTIETPSNPVVEVFCKWTYFGIPADPGLDQFCADSCLKDGAVDEASCPFDLCTCGEASCGDGKVKGKEQCDDGVNNGKDGYCGADCGLKETRCEPGTFFDTASKTCKPCGAGSYQTESGQPDCVPCPPGSAQPDEGATTCLGCPQGHYNAHAGSIECLECPAGTYQNDPGKSFCRNCPACGANSKCSDGPEGNGTCVCDEGFVKNAETGACETAARTCPAGQFDNGTECQNCVGGSFTAEPGATECTLCLPGQEQMDEGQTGCTPCQPGYAMGTAGAMACIECEAGNYAPDAGATECIACPACGEGGSCDKVQGCVCTDGFKLEGGVCVPDARVCPAGQYDNGTECIDCAPGSSSQAGATQCTFCDPGTIAAEAGAASCVLCPAGTFQEGTGATLCENCPAGHYGATDGAVECMVCAPGTYQPATGQIMCLNCPDCGDHGACKDGAGDGTCECNEGYAGAACGTCAQGFADDGNGICVRVPNVLHFQGLDGDHEGIAMWWNGVANLGESAGRGHAIPAPYNTCKPDGVNDYNYNDNAYANMASRDYEGIDPQSAAGAHITQIEGFATFAQALTDANAALGDVKLIWTAATLGADAQGSDWSFDGSVESRKYTGGTFTFLLNGEELVSAQTPVLYVTVDYVDSDVCTDDRISAVSEQVPAASFNIVYAGGDATITAVAQGLVDDITAMGALSLLFDSVQPAGQAEFTDGDGRDGAFFEVQTLRLERGCDGDFYWDAADNCVPCPENTHGGTIPGSTCVPDAGH